MTGAVAGTDLSVGDGTLSFGPGTTLASTITGTTPDTGYDQLSVAGRVNLSGVGVALAGPLVPVVGTAFDLVNATTAASGNFGPATTTLNGVLLRLGATATTGTATAIPLPTTTGIPSQAVQAGGPSTAVDLNAFFTDPATPVVYTIIGNTNPAFGAAAISGSTLTLTGLAAGTTTITVRLTDANGQFVDSMFTLTVNPAPRAHRYLRARHPTKPARPATPNGVVRGGYGRWWGPSQRLQRRRLPAIRPDPLRGLPRRHDRGDRGRQQRRHRGRHHRHRHRLLARQGVRRRHRGRTALLPGLRWLPGRHYGCGR